jgi:hypothetical protein
MTGSVCIPTNLQGTVQNHLITESSIHSTAHCRLDLDSCTFFSLQAAESCVYVCKWPDRGPGLFVSRAYMMIVRTIVTFGFHFSIGPSGFNTLGSTRDDLTPCIYDRSPYIYDRSPYRSFPECRDLAAGVGRRQSFREEVTGSATAVQQHCDGIATALYQ